MTQAQTPTPFSQRETLSSEEMYDYAVEDYQLRKAHPELMGGIQLPIPWLMKHIRIRPGWVHIWGGKPKVGKSTIQVMLAVALGMAKKNTLYITLEDDMLMTAQRVLSTYSISREHLLDANLTPVEETRLYTDAKTFKQFPVTWTSNCYTEAEIIARAVAMPTPPDWILLDQIHQVMYPGQDQRERIESTCEFLRRVSRGYYSKGRPIGISANLQLNDQNESWGSRAPNRISDVYCKINMVPDGHNGFLPDKRQILVEYNRHGAAGDHHVFTFWGDFNRIGEVIQQTTGIPKP